MKVTAQELEVVGIVKHVRGDDPVNPKEVRLYVDPDGDWEGPKTDIGCRCGHPHVEVRPTWVKEVL